MKIGELAQATQTPAQTIRYYEREGLMPLAARSEGNYRRYGRAEVERLTLIRRCRALDMSLSEVRRLLQLRDAPEVGCDALAALLDEHLAHVGERLRELRALQAELKQLRQACTGPQVARDCGILQGLQAEGPLRNAAKPHLPGTHR